MSLAEVEEFWIMLVCNSKGVLIMKILTHIMLLFFDIFAVNITNFNAV